MAAVRVRGLLAPAPAPQLWVAPLWRRCPRALCSYAKLGLQRGASDDAVRQAFREAAQLHHPDKVGGDRARFEECKAAADAILDRTEGDEPPRWQRRSKPRTEDRDDESHWDHGFGSSERVYNDERDFDRPEDPEQRANDSARVHYIFKVLLGIIAARFFVVGIFSQLPTEPDLVRRKLQAEAELPLRAASVEAPLQARTRPRCAPARGPNGAPTSQALARAASRPVVRLQQ